jgi:hypothetical protein
MCLLDEQDRAMSRIVGFPSDANAMCLPQANISGTPLCVRQAVARNGRPAGRRGTNRAARVGRIGIHIAL